MIDLSRQLKDLLRERDDAWGAASAAARRYHATPSERAWNRFRMAEVTHADAEAALWAFMARVDGPATNDPTNGGEA